MRSLCVLALLLTCFGLQMSTAQKVSSIKTEIIEFVSDNDGYSNRSNEIAVYPNKPPNSQLIIGEDTSIGSRILLKCTANFPVQWIYLGDGQPEFTTYTNVEWMGNGGTPLRFSAEASLGLLGFQRALRETDTGNYTCRNIQDPNILVYYYIYVPGSTLFARKGGENITYSYKDQSVRIPCSISDPTTSVTLCKFVHKSLQCPVKDASYTYDPKKGFQLDLWNQPNPSGTYVCAGSNNNLYKVVEYTLIPTSQPIYKDPCDPSPCGYQAECSANSDGTAICYCFRGYNGNPYDQCKNGPVEGKKCYGNDECPVSKSCVLGKCADPCDPSPCGKGSNCEVYGRKARCSCQKGFEGRPPYCKKSCIDDYDCGRNEMCSKKFCTEGCQPGSCGTNADCAVIQRGGQRKIVCTCPSGMTGDPSRRCRSIGGDSSSPPWNSCPVGYIGKPPHCETPECEVDEDCSPEKSCISNICQRRDPPSKGSDQSLNCNEQCGLNAECKKSLFSNEAQCECISGYSGDPELFCSADTGKGKPSRDNPCKPNPCADFGDCKVVNGKAKCKPESTPSKCPKGFIGKPPKCRPDDDFANGPDGDESCEFDFDCAPGQDCVNERCTKVSKLPPIEVNDDDECEGTCGINAECKKNPDLSDELEYDCFCRKGYKGNPYTTCKPISDSSSTPSSLCDPSPCAKLASCRVINGQGVCKCPRGFRGDPYVDCSRGPSSFYPSTTESPFLVRTRPTTRRGSKRDECELEDDSLPYYRVGFVSDSCGRNEKCELVNGFKKCVCKAGFVGKPPDCEKYSQTYRCVKDDDCSDDETCRNFFCVNLCSREYKYPCASNAECRVVDKNPLCSCSRGYVGDPRYHCRPSSSSSTPFSYGGRRELPISSSSTSNRNYACDTSSLNCRGSNTEASCVDGEPLCVCKKGYVGYPPNCRLECEKNSHCYKSKVCSRNQCVDPCENENACSPHEKCTVLNHILMCLPKTSYSNTNPCLNGYRSSRCRYE